jgi:hypothetical protein
MFVLDKRQNSRDVGDSGERDHQIGVDIGLGLGGEAEHQLAAVGGIAAAGDDALAEEGAGDPQTCGVGHAGGEREARLVEARIIDQTGSPAAAGM